MNLKLAFLAVSNVLHRVTLGVCLVLAAFVFAGQLTVVVLRYVFATGSLQLQDGVTYAFAVLMVLSIPLAIRLNRHVRVDVLREILPPSTARKIDVAGVLILLSPVFIAIFMTSLAPTYYAWSILEGSMETGGLPGFYLVKTAIPFSAALMIIQGGAILADRKLWSQPAREQGSGAKGDRLDR